MEKTNLGKCVKCTVGNHFSKKTYDYKASNLIDKLLATAHFKNKIQTIQVDHGKHL